MISWHRDNESHNAGQNCLGCHRSDGSGERNFTTAGTVYKPDQTRVYTNVTVKIYHTEKMEQPVERIEVDGKGNFLYDNTSGLGSRIMGFSHQRE